jgi:hypothetical protein
LNCSRTVREAFKKDRRDSGILDFDARVPIPFSVFPSSYRSDATTETTEKVRVEAELELPDQASRVGREGHEGRYQTEHRTERRFEEPSRYRKETVRIQERERLPEERVTRRVQVTRDR